MGEVIDYKKYLDQIEAPPKFELKWIWTVAGPGAIIASLTIGSGELVWTPRAAAAFGYVMVWAFLYGVWIKGIVQYLANRWHALTGIPTSVACSRVYTKWFNLFLLITILSVMPMWFNILSSLSAQVLWISLGRPAPLYYFWILVVAATLLLLIFAAKLGRAYKAIETISLAVLWFMFIAFWVATLIGTRPDWGAFFGNLFIPRPIPPYEPWIQKAAPDIWALTPFMLLGTALGALGGGIQDYVGYQAMLREKGWGLLRFSDEILKRVATIGLPKKVPLPEDEEARRKIKGWLLPVAFDCGLSYFMVFIVTIPAVILTIEVLRPRHMAPSGLTLVAAQVGWLTETLGPWAGIIWWIGSFFAFWGTFYGLHEVYMWTIYDMARGTFKKAVDVTPDKVRLYLWPYLVIVGAIYFFTGFSLPILAAFASAATHLFALAIWGIALLYLNMKYLPKPYRPHIILVILALVGICVYLPYGLIQLIQVFIPTFTI